SPEGSQHQRQNGDESDHTDGNAMLLHPISTPSEASRRGASRRCLCLDGSVAGPPFACIAASIRRNVRTTALLSFPPPGTSGRASALRRVAVERQLDDQRRPGALRALDTHRPAHRLRSVLEAEQSGPATWVCAADAVVANG